MALWKRASKLGPLKPTANPYPSRFQKWRHSLVLRFLLILAVGLTIRFYPPVYNFTQSEFFEAVSIAQGSFEYPFRKSKVLFSEALTYLSLKEKNTDLIAENKSLKQQLQLALPAQNEIKLLKANLGIKEQNKNYQTSARVIASPYDGLHYFLVVAIGTRDKVVSGQAVIAPEGIVGRLTNVGKYVSRVLLINDIDSKIPVVTAHSGQNAILAGESDDFPKLVYVKDSSKIEPNEPILTSGFGGVFPPGLPVGNVHKIDNGMISVKPIVNFSHLNWVQILQAPQGYLEELQATLEGE